MKRYVYTVVLIIGLVSALGTITYARCGSDSCGVSKEISGCHKREASSCGRSKKSCGADKAGCGKQRMESCKGGVCMTKPVAGKESSNHAEINTSGLKALLAANADLVLVDARSGKYDDGKRIPGAQSLNSGSSEKEIESVVSDKNALIVTYCSNLKCPASAQLAEKLRKLGYDNVIEYPNGIQGWIEDGNEVVEAGS